MWMVQGQPAKTADRPSFCYLSPRAARREKQNEKPMAPLCGLGLGNQPTAVGGIHLSSSQFCVGGIPKATASNTITLIDCRAWLSEIPSGIMLCE
jgi:hypothetical protein